MPSITHTIHLHMTNAVAGLQLKDLTHVSEIPSVNLLLNMSNSAIGIRTLT